LQRRLSELEDEGKIEKSGHTSGTRYHLFKPSTPQQQTIEATQSRPEAFAPSPIALSIYKHVKRPVDQRPNVGYQRSFLDQYFPNKTYYLSVEERQLLKTIGHTPNQHQPAGTYARQILNRLLIDLAWNSSRLEGNTYSLLDTERLLNKGSQSIGKSAQETQMILNHKEAIEFIVENAGETIGMNRYTITNLHALLSTDLLPDPGAPGRLRTFAVGIGGSTYTPLDIPQQIAELFDLLLQKAAAINDPFEQTFFVMVHIPYLQPFDDVNKRVSRLAANIPLNRFNLAPLSFTDVSPEYYVAGLLGVYELNRVELLKEVFIWAYQRSAVLYAQARQTIGEPDPFRVRYRTEMRQLVGTIIREMLNRQEAAEHIREKAADLPADDEQPFIKLVETELLNLHDGNFARYQVSPRQYSQWREVWD
jgi:hypothetical protein